MQLVTMTALQEEAVREIYEEAFPDAEKRPWERMLRFAAEGKLDILAMIEDETLVGLVVLANHGDLVLLDYLAVTPRRRSGGYGAKALAALLAKTAGKTLFLEAELPEPNAPDDSIQNRRLRFYERNGFSICGVNICFFGVPMTLMTAGEPVDFERYAKLLVAVNGEWVLEHITRLEEANGSMI